MKRSLALFLIQMRFTLMLRIPVMFIVFLMITSVAVAQETDATKKLKARSNEFREEVIQVAEDTYTAVGISVSNSSMIVGDDGAIIIDTGLDAARGERIAAEFRKITGKPVHAIIYTHGHGDHTGGSSAFVGDANPQIWARSNFGSEQRPWEEAGLTIQNTRGARQGGFKLSPDKRINNGVAPAHYPDRSGTFESGAVAPTNTFTETEKSLTIAGVDLELVAAPGETDDQLYVWLPKQRVLFAGDTFYKSFPNLYAIRGTQYRDVNDWANSLDAMLKHDAIALVGGHTRPIVGADQVREVLTNYRDAVRFVHDKTVEGMNEGLTPDELVEYVRLPDHLADKDYLQEFYGNVQWSVRSIFNGYLGWFDGNPTNLFRLAPAEEARRIADLAGGVDVLTKRAIEANESDDPQWAAQLTDYLLALNPESTEAKKIKAEALVRLGERCMTATGRNYYLTVAQELLE